MERLNLTLDADTARAIERHAQRAGKRRATVARELIVEALGRREKLERQRKLAHDYAAGCSEVQELLGDLEAPQFELFDDDQAS